MCLKVVKMGVFREFQYILYFSHVSPSGAHSPEQWKTNKNRKMTTFRHPKCGLQGVPKNCKKWSLARNPYQTSWRVSKVSKWVFLGGAKVVFLEVSKSGFLGCQSGQKRVPGGAAVLPLVWPWNMVKTGRIHATGLWSKSGSEKWVRKVEKWVRKVAISQKCQNWEKRVNARHRLRDNDKTDISGQKGHFWPKGTFLA